MSNFLRVSPELLDLGMINDTHLIYHQQSNRDIYLGDLEYQYLFSLDGNTGVEELVKKFPLLNLQKIEKLNEVLCQKGLISGYEQQAKRNWLSFSLFSIKANRRKKYGNTMLKVINFFFLLSFFIPILLIVKYVTETNINELFIWIHKITIAKGILCLLVMFLSMCLHEIGHTIMSRANAAFVIKYNFGFLSFVPCLSTVIAGLAKIKLKDRIKISLSGIAVNLWICAIAVLLNLVNNNYILDFIVVFNLIVVLFNLIIFIDTDGWQILNILINYHNSSEKDNQTGVVSQMSVKNIIVVLRLCLVISFCYTLFFN